MSATINRFNVLEQLEKMFDVTGEITAIPTLNQFAQDSCLRIPLKIEKSDQPLSGVVTFELWFKNDELQNLVALKKGVRLRLKGMIDSDVGHNPDGSEVSIIKYVATEYEIIKEG